MLAIRVVVFFVLNVGQQFRNKCDQNALDDRSQIIEINSGSESVVSYDPENPNTLSRPRYSSLLCRICFLLKLLVLHPMSMN